MPAPSIRAFACGVTGSGKTTALRALFLSAVPRVLVLDQTGEWGEPDAVTLPELRRALHRAAGAREWRIVAALEVGELPGLATLLGATPGRESYTAAVGGLALAVDEADVIAGRHAPPRITALWRRGRHVGLSIFAASQRPADVHRAVTSQSEWLVVCRTHEPRDVAYLAGMLPAEGLAELDKLPPFGALLWSTSSRAGYVIDAARRIVRQVGDAPAPAARARAVIAHARAVTGKLKI